MSPIETGTLSLQNFLPYRLSTISNRISLSLANKYNKRFGINVHQWRIMAALGEERKLSAVAITHHIAMDKVTVSRGVKSLIEKQLVVKNLDPNDNRSYSLSLSDKGFDMYKELVPIALEHERQTIKNLTKEEQEVLNRLLDKLDNDS